MLGESSGGLTGDGSGGTAFASRDHDEEFHDAVVDPGAATLHNEDILIPDRSVDAHVGLAIAEFLQLAASWLSAQAFADGFRQEWMRGAREDLHPAHIALLAPP